MRAVVHDRYGPPEVLRIAEVERPVPERGRGPRQGPRHDGHPVRLPGFAAPAVHLPLLHRPPPTEAEDPGMELAGEVEAVGAAVTRVRGRRPVFGVRGSGAQRGVRLRPRERRARAQAGRHDLRGGRGGLRRRDPRARVSAKGGSARGAERSRLRRVRGHRHGRSAAGQALRRRTSPPSATRRTSSSCARSAPTR